MRKKSRRASGRPRPLQPVLHQSSGPSSQSGEQRQRCGCPAAAAGTSLRSLLKYLLIALFAMAMVCLFNHAARFIQTLDRMVVAWTLMVQLMQRIGMVGRFEPPPELVNFMAHRNHSI